MLVTSARGRDAASQLHSAISTLRRKNNSLAAAIAGLLRSVDHANLQEAQRWQSLVVRRGRHVDRLIRFIDSASALVVA
jgi:hypothetical protein